MRKGAVISVFYKCVDILCASIDYLDLSQITYFAASNISCKSNV